MTEEAVLIKEKDMADLILQSLFSEETERYFANCDFTSNRMAFLQGMNYAALLCIARLEKYHSVIITYDSEESDG